VATARDGKHYFINISGRQNAVLKQRVVKNLPIDPPWAHRLCTGLCTAPRTPQKSVASLQICDTASITSCGHCSKHGGKFAQYLSANWSPRPEQPGFVHFDAPQQGR